MLKLFIVEDSDHVRERLIALLSDVGGVEVVGQARNHAEALAGITGLNPHAVVLDIQMSGESGIDVLKAIRRNSRPPVTVMLTNQASPQYRKKCMEWGADFFLDKSAELESLVSIFRLLVKLHAAVGAVSEAAGRT
jgi:DNA-binding NarL/FixJ family response regulator